MHTPPGTSCTKESMVFGVRPPSFLNQHHTEGALTCATLQRRRCNGIDVSPWKPTGHYGKHDVMMKTTNRYISQRRQRTVELRITCSENLVTIGCVVPEICLCTDIQTDGWPNTSNMPMPNGFRSQLADEQTETAVS